MLQAAAPELEAAGVAPPLAAGLARSGFWIVGVTALVAAWDAVQLLRRGLARGAPGGSA